MIKRRRPRLLTAGRGIVACLLLILVVPQLAGAAQTRVILRSSPDGATVSAEDLGYLGTTDVAVDLKRRSTVELLFSKPGYRDLRVGRKIKGKEMTVDVVLEPWPATSIAVRLDPPHARFKLSTTDGVVVLEGQSNEAYELPGGGPWTGESRRFVVEAWCPGYHNERAEVVLDQYEHHELAFTLVGVSTRLRVTSDPTGAKVSEEALGYLGTTPLEVEVALENLVRTGLVAAPGDEPEVTLELTVEKSGFETDRQSVRLSFGLERNEIRCLLERSY